MQIIVLIANIMVTSSFPDFYEIRKGLDGRFLRFDYVCIVSKNFLDDCLFSAALVFAEKRTAKGRNKDLKRKTKVPESVAGLSLIHI